MSDKVIPERCTHNTIVRTTDNMNCDPWWWECDDCGKQFVDREQLSAAEAALSEARQELKKEKEYAIFERQEDERCIAFWKAETQEYRTVAEAELRCSKELSARVAQLQATICTLQESRDNWHRRSNELEERVRALEMGSRE